MARKSLEEIFGGSVAPTTAPATSQRKSLDEIFGNSSGTVSTAQNTAQPENKSFIEKASEFVPNVALGFAKRAGSTLARASEAGEKYLLNPIDRLMGNKVPEQSSAETLGINKALELDNTAQKIGGGIEQIAEFLLPGGASVKAGNTVKTLLGSSKLAKVASLGTRAATEAGIVGGQTALQEGGFDNKAKTAAIVAGLFPIAGAGLSVLKQGVGKVGQKIEQSVIRPNAEDLADGFNIQNLTKYNVGGSLKEIVANTHIKLNELGQQLKTKLAGSNTAVNLNNVLNETAEDLLKNKGVNFGNVTAIKRVLEDQLKPEIIEQAGQNGLVDLVEANFIKRGAGTKGAWAFGRVEPDATAVEKVYTTFYNKLKIAIEKNAPEGVKELNKQMSELIPISNAALRRLPVEQRNNIISLTDNIGLFSAMFDPRSLALLGANRLAKSGKFGNFLMKVAESAKNPSKTTIGKRIFGN